MSRTPSEFLETVRAFINHGSLQKIAKAAEGQPHASSSIASMIIEHAVRELDGMGESVGCLEMVKFKILIGDLPEQWWPKPDVQKGGE